MIILGFTGDSGMPWYRLYHLDRRSGHIDGAEEMFASDDVSAVHDLQQRRNDHPLELWQGGRKVVHLEAAARYGVPLRL